MPVSVFGRQISPAPSHKLSLRRPSPGGPSLNLVQSTSLVLALALGALAAALQASDAPARVPVVFPDGATQATLAGRIVGRTGNDHVLRVEAGQTLRVTLHADSSMAYFNVRAPGSDEAIFIGSTRGSHYRGVVRRGGDYVIRTYLMAAGARRGQSSNYRLDISLAHEPPAPPRSPAQSLPHPPRAAAAPSSAFPLRPTKEVMP